jgi:hypothetical protein
MLHAISLCDCLIFRIWVHSHLKRLFARPVSLVHACAAVIFNVFNGALHVGIKSFARSSFVSQLKDAYLAEPGMEAVRRIVSSRVFHYSKTPQCDAIPGIARARISTPLNDDALSRCFHHFFHNMMGFTNLRFSFITIRCVLFNANSMQIRSQTSTAPSPTTSCATWHSPSAPCDPRAMRRRTPTR